MKPKRASLSVRVLIVFISTIATLALSELLLRATGFEINPLKVESRGRSDYRFFHVFEDEYFVYDPVLIWKPKPGFSVFSSQGFRGPELPEPKPRGSFRIFAIGDSNTLGWLGKLGSWPSYLQKIIDSNGRNATVVNAGVFGYSSYQGLLRFEESLQYSPDIALISFGANDAHQVRVPDREFSAKEMRGGRYIKFLKHFHLGNLLLYVFNKNPDNDSGTLMPRVSVQEYTQNLESIVLIAHDNRIRPILLTRPYFGVGKDSTKWKYYAPQYYEATKQVASKHGVLLIDVYQLFKEQKKYFADESHFTHAGHHVAAGYIYEAMKQFIPPKNQSSISFSSGTTSGALTSGSSSLTNTPK